jgi:hypothetical protein
VAVGQRLEHRDAFGADRQPIGRVLDVAAGDHRSVGSFKRGAHLEMRERGLRVLPRAPRGSDDIHVAAAVPQTSRSDAAIATAAPVTVRATGVLGSAIESGATIRLAPLAGANLW